MTILEARHIGVGIQCQYDEARAFLSDPLNLPRWAAGLAGGIRASGDEWIINTPHGEARLRFTAPNEFGVLDHTVIFAPEILVHVPMRVLKNADGCEVVLTLYRQPGMDDAQYEHDTELVRQDLNSLKRVLETNPR